ncbi:MAG: hypothetical protein R3338_08605 [Thermoanaerobaculia bacterium]|nr:hypothetical protein [Thermoanaerobaculia bacterium]
MCAHEGRIFAENRPGGGAAFHLFLPRVEENPHRPSSSQHF